MLTISKKFLTTTCRLMFDSNKLDTLVQPNQHVKLTTMVSKHWEMWKVEWENLSERCSRRKTETRSEIIFIAKLPKICQYWKKNMRFYIEVEYISKTRCTIKSITRQLLWNCRTRKKTIFKSFRRKDRSPSKEV
jgi:hypothetical protein